MGVPMVCLQGRDAALGIGLSPSGLLSGWRETEGRQWEQQGLRERENKRRKLRDWGH